MDPVTVALGLAQFAPQIIKWVTGSAKAEQAAQTVVGVAQAITGKGSGPEALETLKADPNKALEFRQAIAAQEVELDKAYLADRQDARRRDVELHKSGYRNIRADLMVMGAVVGLISCLVVLVAFQEKVPGEVVGIVSTVAGIFGACLRDAFMFEFGSSRGSRDKDSLVAGRRRINYDGDF